VTAAGGQPERGLAVNGFLSWLITDGRRGDGDWV
jgi:hypothetical protein